LHLGILDKQQLVLVDISKYTISSKNRIGRPPFCALYQPIYLNKHSHQAPFYMTSIGLSYTIMIERKSTQPQVTVIR
jgi:hypothetical protein